MEKEPRKDVASFRHLLRAFFQAFEAAPIRFDLYHFSTVRAFSHLTSVQKQTKCHSFRAGSRFSSFAYSKVEGKRLFIPRVYVNCGPSSCFEGRAFGDLGL